MITLINAAQIKKIQGLSMNWPAPPMGLAYIAAALRRAGHTPTVIDAVGEGIDEVRSGSRDDFLVQGLSVDAILERIPAQTHVVGVSVNFSSQWLVARPLLAAIRDRRPDVRIVAGGEHFSATPEYSLRSGLVDVCVLGEGEETAVALTERLLADRDLADLKGVAYLGADGAYVTTGLPARVKKIDDIPLPHWESFPVRAYLDAQQSHVGTYAGRTMPILGSRGCPYACTFCSNEFMWTPRWIPRSPKLVVDEMEAYVRTYGVENFDFWDLTAFVKKSWILEFCQELIDRRLGVSWQLPVGTRSEVFDDQVARAIYASGCRYVNFAPESGSEEILRKVKKKINLPHLREAVQVAVRNDLRIGCFLVLGFPEDTEATMAETRGLVRDLAKLGCSDITPNKFIPYPGSPLFKELQRDGKIKMDDEFFGNVLDFYKETRRSYCDNLTARRIYVHMWRMIVTFYGWSFLHDPVRMLRDLVSGMFSKRENTKFVKLFHEVLRHRARWKARARRLAVAPASPVLTGPGGAARGNS
jgi:radical SAM superfamily enzyme YgiQ (UPF0313 family)